MIEIAEYLHHIPFTRSANREFARFLSLAGCGETAFVCCAVGAFHALVRTLQEHSGGNVVWRWEGGCTVVPTPMVVRDLVGPESRQRGMDQVFIEDAPAMPVRQLEIHFGKTDDHLIHSTSSALNISPEQTLLAAVTYLVGIVGVASACQKRGSLTIRRHDTLVPMWTPDCLERYRDRRVESPALN